MTDKGLRSSLLRYKVMAYVTGTMLLINVLIAVPLEIAGYPEFGNVSWTVHGGLFILYCACVLDLGIRQRWSIARIGLVGLAGAVPVVTFVAERRVVRDVLAASAA